MIQLPTEPRVWLPLLILEMRGRTYQIRYALYKVRRVRVATFGEPRGYTIEVTKVPPDKFLEVLATGEVTTAQREWAGYPLNWKVVG